MNGNGNGQEPIDVDQIPAGWGIDGLVAQRFLGWTRGKSNPRGPFAFYWQSPDGTTVQQPPRLSEDLNLAMLVVEALYELGWKFGLTQNTNGEVVVAFVPKTEGYDPTKAIKVRVVSIKLAALAICRAALLVAEHLHNQERIELPMM